MANAVRMYTTQLCPYCHSARQLLQQLGAEYEEISVDARPDLREEMVRLSGQRTVPQIWIGETHVGGFTDLYALFQGGELQSLLDL